MLFLKSQCLCRSKLFLTPQHHLQPLTPFDGADVSPQAFEQLGQSPEYVWRDHSFCATWAWISDLSERFCAANPAMIFVQESLSMISPISNSQTWPRVYGALCLWLHPQFNGVWAGLWLCLRWNRWDQVYECIQFRYTAYCDEMLQMNETVSRCEKRTVDCPRSSSLRSQCYRRMFRSWHSSKIIGICFLVMFLGVQYRKHENALIGMNSHQRHLIARYRTSVNGCCYSTLWR